MKHFILIIITTLFVTFLSGQAIFNQNAFYVEAGGNGLFASANYERQLAKLPGAGIRIGVGFYSENAFYLTIPIGIDYLFKLKSDRSFIDAGLGAHGHVLTAIYLPVQKVLAVHIL